MLFISKIDINQNSDADAPYGRIFLATGSEYNSMEVPMSQDQAREFMKLAREIVATELRMPMIKERLEAAKSLFPPPALEEPKLEEGPNDYCLTHHRFFNKKNGCPDCAAAEHEAAHKAANEAIEEINKDDGVPY